MLLPGLQGVINWLRKETDSESPNDGVYEDEEDDPKSNVTPQYEIFERTIKVPNLNLVKLLNNTRPQISDRSKYISTKNASELFGLARNTICDLCNKKRIICRKSKINKSQWEVNEISLSLYCSER